MRALAFVLVLGTCAAASAQPADGLYEDFSSVLMAPVAPLAASSSVVPRAVEVETSGGTTHVRFLPDRRVEWEITWGPYGPEEKRTLVDGALFTRSRFEYDGAGHLVRKTVSGPGVGPGIVYDYATDASGRVVRRTAHLPPSAAAGLTGATGTDELVTVTWATDHAVIATSIDGVLAREDRVGLDGRMLSTRIVSADGSSEARLDYVRDGSGALVSITRTLPGRPSAPAASAVPDAGLDASAVALVFGRGFPARVLERHEAHLFLGAPTTSSDAGRGVAREIHDDWGGDCWLNELSGIEFDASGRATASSMGCICGFCVDASAEASADSDVLATDRHWTSGPWIRLDDTLDLTADHEVMTPEGPVAAGELVAGDAVLGADGTPRTLRSVVRLPPGELRLGLNLRTEDGTFAAGGFLLASELPRACPP